MNKVKLIAGRSNPELALLISKRLGINLTQRTITDFSNTEISVTIGEDVRGHDIYILQTGGNYNGKSINDHLMEMCAMVQACKLSSAKSVSVVMPTYPYARGDKKDTCRTTIMGSIVARMLETLGVDRIIAMDLHSGQIQGFTMKPFDNLYAIKLHCEHLHTTIFKGMTLEEINTKYILVSPDVGGVKRVHAYAERLQMAHVTLNKRRDHSKPGQVENSELSGGDDKVKGKIAIMIDDMMDTMGTIKAGAEELMKFGASGVIAICTHGILSGPAIERINLTKEIIKVIVTNTLPQTENQVKCPKLEVVDTSELFAEVIKRIEFGGSISELFK